MQRYIPTIGLEIHAELKTNTKMFCDSKNDPDEKRPNFNICPICMGHPGTLPAINKQAVKHIIKVGTAIGGEIADFSEFDRKNYFYPDIPKGFQISQYKYPLVKGGSLNDIKITRVHLEEDTAKSSHESDDYSLVDFNRAGIPLMELVTEPVIHNSKDASNFAKELQLLLRYLDVSYADMEKGHMRVEANISISNDDNLGVKVEVKNLNSFRSVEKAIEYEIARQTEVILKGDKVIQETRGFDEVKQKTFSQRIKEDSHDYRYFPEPDLPKLKLSTIKEFSKESIHSEMPELPWQKRERYINDYSISKESAEILVRSKIFADYFEKVSKHLKNDASKIKIAINFLISDLLGLIGDTVTDIKIKAEDYSKLILMFKDGEISSRGAKDILMIMFKQGGDPRDIAKEKNLYQKSDEKEIELIVSSVIEKNSKVAEDYQNGKESALQFLVGQGMKESKGKANPEVLNRMISSRLKS